MKYDQRSTINIITCAAAEVHKQDTVESVVQLEFFRGECPPITIVTLIAIPLKMCKYACVFRTVQHLID